jgi:biotin carboxyl carrier protein
MIEGRGGSIQTGKPPASEVISLDAGLWAAFARAGNDAAFLTAWLGLLLNRLPGAEAGAVLEADHAAGAFVPRAVAPDPRRDLADLAGIAERALAAARPLVEPDTDSGQTRLALPLRLGADGPVAAVVTLVLARGAATGAQAALRDMHWAAGWLSSRIWEKEATARDAQMRRAATALDLVALMAEHRRVEPAAMAVVNEIQRVLSADRVSIGLLKGARTSPRIRLLAMSHAAWFRKRSALAEGLETAMEECLDQGGAVATPAPESLARAIRVAHDEHLRTTPSRAMLSVPLPDETGIIGVLTAERRDDRPFSDADVLAGESIGTLIGPVLALKARNRRWVNGRLVDGTGLVFGALLGPRRLSWKLLALALIALGFAAATVSGPFRVQADAVLRGTVQRAAVAPFAGYIDQAPARAGDAVAAGDLLARIDDTDLRLEDLRWRSEIDRLSAQSRDALAQYDRTQVALLEAQIEQARAQLRLTEARLARTVITAPIAGMVVTGDLSQRLGAPVQAGEVLFEIAPLDAFRIDIHVDERDLRHVVPGQTGRLVLTGEPADGRPFAVTRITPINEPREGLNTFRIEAELLPGDPMASRLRPGMGGVAKIDVNEALLSWIWTRRLIDWARRTAWTWQP